MGYRHGDVDPELAERARFLRTHMTPEEKHLWHDYLKLCPYTFNRQYVFKRYIADFYCEEKNLVIEIDGSQHYEPEGLQKDAKRTAYLESLGCKVVRFTNREIHEQFEAVCRRIDFLIHGEP